MMTKILSVIAIAAASLAFTSHASAGLDGTTLKLSVTHSVFTAQSALNNATYTYGSPSTLNVAGWGNIIVTSPAFAPAHQNAVKLDFTAFSYPAFVAPFPANGTAKFLDIAEPFDLDSVRVLVNGMNMTSSVIATGNGFSATWNAAAIHAMNPANPNVVIAWNSMPVPGPASLALLGAAGLVGGTRRRRGA